MKKIFGLIMMTQEELDQIHQDWEERFMEVARELVKSDLELMKLRPREPTSIIGNQFYGKQKHGFYFTTSDFSGLS